MEPQDVYVVLASHLPLRKVSSTVRFIRAVSAVRKQLASADGLVGYTLRAKPLARNYWTLSVWKDRDSLRQFTRKLPHAELMGSLKPLMGTTKFAEWEINGSDGRPSWSEALEHLGAN
jgi:heme-degrading monooxygenase HmoA